MTTFHVELQEVYYRRYEIESVNREEAEAFVMDGAGKFLGMEVVSRLLTNTHEVKDSCSEKCLSSPTEAPDKPV